MLKPNITNSWIVYEIPGHKVGLCFTSNYPERPKMQVNALKGREKGFQIQEDDFKILQQLEELTKSEAMQVEEEWQDKLGYITDGDKRWLSYQKEEVKDKLSKIHKGKITSDETRARMAAARTGTKASDETKAKMSASRKGVAKSDETKARMVAAWKLRRLKNKEGDSDGNK